MPVGYRMDFAPRISWTKQAEPAPSAGTPGLIWECSIRELPQANRAEARPATHAARSHPRRMLQDPPGVIARCLGGSGQADSPKAGVRSLFALIQHSNFCAAASSQSSGAAVGLW